MRLRIPVTLCALLLAVGAALWWSFRDPPGDGTAPAGDSADASAATQQDAAADKDAPHRRRGARQAWVHTGDGSLVGTLCEYGTDRPLSGLLVRLVGAADGPDRAFETRAAADGTFAFERVPEFDDWRLEVVAQAPLRATRMSGVAVSAYQQSDLGVVYVSTAFAVKGLVVETSGAPLAGASVGIVRARQEDAGLDMLRMLRDIGVEARYVDTAETDAAGHFTLDSLSPGTYDVHVVAPRHQLRIERGVIVTPVTESRELRFELPAGRSASGTVVNSSGEAVAGVRVVAILELSGMEMLSGFDRKHFTTTDEQGAFSFDGLDGGTYHFGAIPDQGAMSIVGNVTVPTETGVKLTLSDAAWLEGRVTDETGAGIRRAEVFVMFEQGDTPVLATNVTDESGAYRLAGLPVGKPQALFVRAEGYAGYPSDPMAMMSGRGGDGLELVAGRNERSFQLSAGATVRGLVVTGDDATPLQGARVRLVSTANVLFGSRSATTGEDGRFEVRGVAPGTTLLSVTRDGYIPAAGEELDPSALGAMWMDDPSSEAEDSGTGPALSITRSGQVVERTVRLDPGAVVRGRVVGVDGKPVAGARVGLADEGLASSVLAMMGAATHVSEGRLSGADGRFELRGARPGASVVIDARAPGYAPAKSASVAIAADGTSEPVEIELRRSCTIEGRVTTEDGKPITDVRVTWTVPGAAAESPDEDESFGFGVPDSEAVTTDADGRYRITVAPEGVLLVTFHHDDYVELPDCEVISTPGQVDRLDVRLDDGMEVKGTVLGPDGRPFAGASVQLQGGEDMDQWRATNSDAAGAFRFGGLSAGSFMLHAQHDGLILVGPGVAAVADGPPVTLRFAKAFEISGTVAFADGSPAVGVSVSASMDDDEDEEEFDESEEETTDERGAFTLRGLRPGNYAVRISMGWDEDSANVRGKTVPGVAAGTVGLSVRVEPGLTIEGSVAHADGSPVEDGWVEAEAIGPDGNPQERGDSDDVSGQISNGKLRVAGLSPGSYRLIVSAGGQSMTVTAEAGARGVHVLLAATGGVRGVIRRADGTPAKNCSVEVEGPNGQAFEFSGKQGDYAAEGLPAGRYTVSVSGIFDGAVWVATRADVEVVAGGVTAGIDLVLRREEE